MASKRNTDRRQLKPKSKAAPRGMSKAIEPGVVMTDLMKKEWKLGSVIGQGGFGYIYLCDEASVGQITTSNAKYVIKVEPHANGPLFVELAFYQRVAKTEMITSWSKSNNKKHVGIPVYIGTGSFEHNGTRFRFMIMNRFGNDLEKLYKEKHYKFPKETVYSLGLRILDALEYIHENEYVHADIKSSNIMFGFKGAEQTKIYLLDYGLAYRYSPNGQHVPYKEDPKRKHDGTIEYTSRDAHKGLAPSRRGDMEILAYCMIQWLCKKLPWESKLTDKEHVANQKTKYMNDIESFMKECFGSEVPEPIEKFLQLVNKLEYDERPDYGQIRKLFLYGLKQCGVTDDGASVCLPGKPSPLKRTRSSTSAIVDDDSPSPKKSRSRHAEAKPSSIKKAESRPSRARTSKRRLVRTENDKTDDKIVRVEKSSIKLKNDEVVSDSTLSVMKSTADLEKVTGSIPSAGTSADTLVNGRVVHRRLRRRNVLTRDFGQSP